MGLWFTCPRRAAALGAAAVVVWCPLLAVIGATGAGAAATTTTGPPTTTTALPATTTTTTPPTTAVVVPAPVGASTTTTTTTTTTTAPQHVVNQPDLNALTPHIIALHGSGVQYQFSSGATTQVNGPNVPSYLSSPGGPYLYDANGRVILLHGVNVVYKHAPYIAYPDPGHPWNFSAQDAKKMRRLGFNVVRLGIEWQALEPGSGGPNQAPGLHPWGPGQCA